MTVSYGIRRAEGFGAVRRLMQLCIQEIGHEGVHDLPDFFGLVDLEWECLSFVGAIFVEGFGSFGFFFCHFNPRLWERDERTIDTNHLIIFTSSHHKKGITHLKSYITC